MRLPAIGLATALALFIADQASKYGVTRVMKLDVLSDAYAVTSFFNLRFVANRGVSLGLMTAGSEAARWGLVALTGVIAAGVLVWMTREPKRADQAALGLVLGGAAGNILDRIRLGYVVDFADLHFGTSHPFIALGPTRGALPITFGFHLGAWQPFLVFNVADAAITIGVLILFARAFLVREPDSPNVPEQSPVEKSHA